jgi:acetate kinase
MEHMEDFLDQLPLFKSFSSKELRELIKKGQIRTYAPHDVIIQFGQPGRFLGIMLDGEAEVIVPEKTGSRRVGLFKKGDFLGEMSLLTGEPTSADVIAINKCQLFLVPHEVFSPFLSVNPEAVKLMSKTIIERYRDRLSDEVAQSRLEDAWRRSKDPYGLELSTSMPMKILVLNCGSSSLKFGYFDTEHATNNIEGMVERIGLENSRIIYLSKKVKRNKELGSINFDDGFRAVIELIADPTDGVIKDLNGLTAVGHRVVHGGIKYGGAITIDDEVITDIEKNSVFAPLHNPLNLMVIKESMKLMPGVPQVAVFDTGFHQKIPLHASLYGLPFEFFEKDGIRRYGFHGISHHYVALKAATYLKRNFREVKIISCHLGNGASICAIDHGISVDTSMGLTPLEGLIMGTRCGDLDPSILIHLCKEKGFSIKELDDILNRQSGIKGLSGISSDFRMLEDAASKGEQRALIALHAFCYRIRKYIGAYVAALGGLDALVFTGGIGEGSALARGLACQGLSYMGIEIDDIRNKTISPNPEDVADVSDEYSRVKVLVIPTDEGRMIARETIRALGYRNVTQIIKSQKINKIPIEVSAHHVHLSRREVDSLFGPVYELTYRSDLSQTGQFACEETINLIGPKGKVDNVRILGPIRSQTQVEISMTEEFKLGIKAPIRHSGDLEGSPEIFLEGPKGTCRIPQGVICASRHIHMSPEDALSFGLKDHDLVLVGVKGKRTLVFGDVVVRVNPNFRLAMHIDTDEANAAGIKTGDMGHLISLQDRMN